MTVTAIVGAQWGDEGKGKVTDLLAQDADLIIRFGGGSNAGHTVLNDRGHFRLHLIPSGIFNPKATCLIGTGTVVDLDGLQDEIQQLQTANVAVDGLKISSRAHLVMPYHMLLDRFGDQARGDLAIGTTQRGVGPAYVDKADRIGIQAGDLLDEAVLERKLKLVLEQKNKVLTHWYGQEPVDLESLLGKCGCWADRFGGKIVDHLSLVSEALRDDREILLEGQLGALRDLDWGTYPFVTSSTTIAGGGAVGGGIPPTRIDRVIGVVKAYTSAVGTGPVPTELTGDDGDRLRELGGEFGSTTGRPRRVGWFDAVAVKFAHLLNSFEGLAVTKLDVLDSMPVLRLCTGYELEGTTYSTIPGTSDMEQARPIYEEMPGWQSSTSRARSWGDLPSQARDYLCRIEDLVGAKLVLISVGREREQTVRL